MAPFGHLLVERGIEAAGANLLNSLVNLRNAVMQILQVRADRSACRSLDHVNQFRPVGLDFLVRHEGLRGLGLLLRNLPRLRGLLGPHEFVAQFGHLLLHGAKRRSRLIVPTLHGQVAMPPLLGGQVLVALRGLRLGLRRRLRGGLLGLRGNRLGCRLQRGLRFGLGSQSRLRGIRFGVCLGVDGVGSCALRDD